LDPDTLDVEKYQKLCGEDKVKIYSTEGQMLKLIGCDGKRVTFHLEGGNSTVNKTQKLPSR
jgi:hypothetical protein